MFLHIVASGWYFIIIVGIGHLKLTFDRRVWSVSGHVSGHVSGLVSGHVSGYVSGHLSGSISGYSVTLTCRRWCTTVESCAIIISFSRESL